MKQWQIRHNPKDLGNISPSTTNSTTITSFSNGSLIKTFRNSGKQILISFTAILITCALSFQSTAYGMPSSVGSVQVDGYSVKQIVSSIFHAEGGYKTKYLFGIKSVKCNGFQECQKVCANTVINNIARWHKSGAKQPYLEFLASRYAPIGAPDDPTGLNHNWIKNVRYFLQKGGEL